MWLDGLYMGSPFLAHYGKVFNEPAAFDEVVRQIQLMDQHAYDPASGLFFHGWDEKHAQSWADPKTGRSPSFWGRAIGWYAMAIVDCLDNLPADHRGVGSVKAILERLADGVVRHQDPESGLWWQVLDQGGRDGNYLETSASSMFVYAIAKGINRGYLSREKYQPAVLRGYAGLVGGSIRTDGDGKIHLTRNCEVAGLGFTSGSGRARDGSYGYYISEPVVENDLKGVGPFILAGMEVQRLVSNMNEEARGWAVAAAVLARIKAPEFPARDFPITRYGAMPGQDVTKPLIAAIDACHMAGGGRVVVPAGEWLTGAIHLKSHVNLHVSEGATLRFSTKPADYPVVFTRWEGVECMNYSALIHASGQQNIAVTGGGVLDGQSEVSNWWGWNRKNPKPSLQQDARERLITMGEIGVPVNQRVFGEGSFLRPNFIQFHNCANILVEGVTILRSPMWEIHPVLSKNITIRKVKVASHGPNNDGCDPECCSDVLIEDCVFDTGDDCIAIKSGRNNDGRRVNVPSENIIIRRCVMKDGHGGVVLGSEISGGVRNVFIEDCEMDSPNLDRALRFKSNARRGGVLENVFMRNVRVGHVTEAVLTIDLLYEEGADGPQRPVVRNIWMENITSSDSPRVMWIKGFEGAVIDGIHISNSVFRGIKQKDVIQNAGSIQLDKITREAAHRQ
jgi:unsaturated rhamnogalacturonyl hydrolase